MASSDNKPSLLTLNKDRIGDKGMKEIDITNEGGVTTKYDVVNDATCKNCLYCLLHDGKHLCRHDKECHIKATDERKQKVIIYSRVSTEKQTLEQQERTVNEWLRAHNLQATHEVSDEGVSGGITYKDRNLGKVVLPMLDEGDVLIVAEISRLGRSMSDINKLVNDELKPRKIRLVIVQMGIDLDCGHIKAIDEMLLFAFSFSAQMEKELIQERTQSALEVRKKKLEEQGEFISKAGNVVKKLGRPKKCKTDEATTASVSKRKKEAAEKPCNKAIWSVVKKCTDNFTKLTTPNFADAAIMLQQMGIFSSTGQVLTKERVRSAYYNLRKVYGEELYFRRDSADYRLLLEQGYTDAEIRKMYRDKNKEIRNNNKEKEA